MNRIFAIVLLAFASSLCVLAETPRTMRLDYFHTGNVAQETFSIDKVVLEPLPWPGNPRKAIDNTNLGTYLFEVRDQKSDQVLYSRGFASIYGEWITTDEPKTMTRTFSESLRFPAPDAPVKIVLKGRDPKNNFRDLWTTTIDPKDMFIDRSRPATSGQLISIERTVIRRIKLISLSSATATPQSNSRNSKRMRGG